MTPADALQHAIFALPYCQTPEHAERVLTDASNRGVTEDKVDTLRRAWQDYKARTVVVIGGVR